MSSIPQPTTNIHMAETHRPIRLHILSDLHLSRADLPPPSTEADIVILAGDISRPQEAIAWAGGFSQPVLYVAGNHEFYGYGIRETISLLKQHARGTRIHVLDDEALMLHGIRFLGSTLWTGFNLAGPGQAREQAIAQALELTYDFRRIKSDESPGMALSPVEMEALFHRHRGWLEQNLALPFDGPTVVITHHAPSRQSIHPRFEGSLLNTCFVSDSEYLMGADRAALWVHGHTHDSFDYAVNGTRVVCNPRGYVRDGINENPAFDPGLVIELGAA